MENGILPFPAPSLYSAVLFIFLHRTAISHSIKKTAEAVFFYLPYFSTDGSQVAMPGKKQRSAISSTMMKAKGAEPAMIS